MGRNVSVGVRRERDRNSAVDGLEGRAFDGIEVVESRQNRAVDTSQVCIGSQTIDRQFAIDGRGVNTAMDALDLDSSVDVVDLLQYGMAWHFDIVFNGRRIVPLP